MGSEKKSYQHPIVQKTMPFEEKVILFFQCGLFLWEKTTHHLLQIKACKGVKKIRWHWQAYHRRRRAYTYVTTTGYIFFEDTISHFCAKQRLVMLKKNSVNCNQLYGIWKCLKMIFSVNQFLSFKKEWIMLLKNGLSYISLPLKQSG